MPNLKQKNCEDKLQNIWFDPTTIEPQFTISVAGALSTRLDHYIEWIGYFAFGLLQKSRQAFLTAKTLTPSIDTRNYFFEAEN